MKSDDQKIIFINRSGTGEKIVVQDQESARVLEQALNQFSNQTWVRVSQDSTPNFTQESLPSQEFRVILLCGSSTFRSTTRRLSLNSLQLKTQVPNAFVGPECVVYISNASLTEQIELRCTVAVDPNGESVLNFNRSEDNEIKRLEQWIQPADNAA